MRLLAIFYLMAQLMLINQAARAADSTDIKLPKTVTSSVLVPVIDYTRCQAPPDEAATAGLYFYACVTNSLVPGCTNWNTSKIIAHKCPVGYVLTNITTNGEVQNNGGDGVRYMQAHLTSNCCPIVYQWKQMSTIGACTASNPIYCIIP